MKLILSIILILILTKAYGQNPDPQWMRYEKTEQVGFSSEKLKKVSELYKSNGADALLIIYKGNILYSEGEIIRRFDCHSIRKSLLNSIYGIYVDKGLIDIKKTLDVLQVNDSIGLTENEKSATVEDLLKSKSGIYIPAIGESKEMAESRPSRGSHKAGEFFYYNNWDFNVLNTIFKNETGINVIEAFYNSIVLPLGMEDFRKADCKLWLDYTINTIHPKLDIRISSRDLARFGVLYCNHGVWNEQQIISENWIQKSFKPYSLIDYGNYSESYGFMWWIEKLNDEITIYSGRGWGGHVLTIIPSMEIVMVKRHDTYKSNGGDGWTGNYVKAILNAKIDEEVDNPKLVPLEIVDSIKLKTISLSNMELTKYEQTVFYKGKQRGIRLRNNSLIFDENFTLYPISKSKFYIEDYDMNMYFINEDDRPIFDKIE